jgi:hypothetical protein
LCPFPVNPFPDVRRTIPEFDAPTFAERQKVHGVPANEGDVGKIDGDGAVFLSNRRAKNVNVVPFNPSADAQHGQVPFSESVDSARHSLDRVRQQTVVHS